VSAELLTHEIRQRRVGAGALAVIIAAFGVLALGIAEAIGGLLDDITAGFPESLGAFLGADSPGGYVTGEMFNLVFPIAVVAFAVIVGASALAGEERDGTMAMLSAQPVSRTRVLWAKAGGVALALVAVVGLNWVGMAGFITSGATALTLAGLTGGTVHLLSLGLAFAAIAFAVSAATGRPSVGSSTAGGIAVVAYLTATMLPIAGLESWARLSPWYYYLGRSAPLSNGLNLADLGVFTAVIAVCMALAVLTYRRRDLKG